MGSTKKRSGPWTDEEREYVKKALQQGLTYKQMAKELGRSTGGISQAIYKMGLNKWAMGKDAICWDCKNATGGCSWSQFLLPIEGWKTIKQENGLIRVIKCPQFQKG